MTSVITSENVSNARVRRIAAAVAILFGIASLGAGGGVLAGRDPGYVVYRPLVMFNTLMGALYIGVGVLLWRRTRPAHLATAGIVVANLLVLAYVMILYRSGGAIAIDSVRAMVLRSGVWLVLLLMVLWSRSRSPQAM